MTDRFETYEKYIQVCDVHKKDQHPVIVHIFEKDGTNLPENK